MDLAKQMYGDHLTRVLAHLERALETAALEMADDVGGIAASGIVFDAGPERFYPADDQAVPFRPHPHFARIAPIASPGHLLVVRPGDRPELLIVIPRDYWYESPILPDHPFVEHLSITIVGSREEAVRTLGPTARYAYVGDDRAVAEALQIPSSGICPGPLVAALDWFRGFKTPYEVECVRDAACIAALGHRAARDAMMKGASEYEIHFAYLQAAQLLDLETPYPNIIAWDDRSAILHYQRRRRDPPDPGRSFLIDAGATSQGYACDITRTYASAVSPKGPQPLFGELLDRMDALQRQLVAAVEPGVSFIDLHRRAEQGVAGILAELRILLIPSAQAVERGIARVFLPHGLGHHLGLQVHDVGGTLRSERGVVRERPHDLPYLRTTRDLQPGNLVTIEPGLYFVPSLLEEVRSGPSREALDWTLVDALVPCGGIRIEDDVLVTELGREDLTRPLVPSHVD